MVFPLMYPRNLFQLYASCRVGIRTSLWTANFAIFCDNSIQLRSDLHFMCTLLLFYIPYNKFMCVLYYSKHKKDYLLRNRFTLKRKKKKKIFEYFHKSQAIFSCLISIVKNCVSLFFSLVALQNSDLGGLKQSGDVKN